MNEDVKKDTLTKYIITNDNENVKNEFNNEIQQKYLSDFANKPQLPKTSYLIDVYNNYQKSRKMSDENDFANYVDNQNINKDYQQEKYILSAEDIFPEIIPEITDTHITFGNVQPNKLINLINNYELLKICDELDKNANKNETTNEVSHVKIPLFIGLMLSLRNKWSDDLTIETFFNNVKIQIGKDVKRQYTTINDGLNVGGDLKSHKYTKEDIRAIQACDIFNLKLLNYINDIKKDEGDDKKYDLMNKISSITTQFTFGWMTDAFVTVIYNYENLIKKPFENHVTVFINTTEKDDMGAKYIKIILNDAETIVRLVVSYTLTAMYMSSLGLKTEECGILYYVVDFNVKNDIFYLKYLCADYDYKKHNNFVEKQLNAEKDELIKMSQIHSNRYTPDNNNDNYKDKNKIDKIKNAINENPNATAGTALLTMSALSAIPIALFLLGGKHETKKKKEKRKRNFLKKNIRKTKKYFNKNIKRTRKNIHKKYIKTKKYFKKMLKRNK
jgi:hypothetical protein